MDEEGEGGERLCVGEPDQLIYIGRLVSATKGASSGPAEGEKGARGGVHDDDDRRPMLDDRLLRAREAISGKRDISPTGCEKDLTTLL